MNDTAEKPASSVRSTSKNAAIFGPEGPSRISRVSLSWSNRAPPPPPGSPDDILGWRLADREGFEPRTLRVSGSRVLVRGTGRTRIVAGAVAERLKAPA